MTKDNQDFLDGIKDVESNNAALLADMEKVETGDVKSAAVAGSNMIRRKIRENGFCRRIIPPQSIGNDDLDRSATHSRPYRIEEMEPLSKAAVNIPFGTSTDTEFYYENKFEMFFSTYSTNEYTKDINELRTTRMDLRQVITDNSLNEVQNQEDGRFIAMCNLIVGATNGVGASGVQQNWNINGGITRDTFVEATNKLDDASLNNGVFLMNRRTGKEFLKWTRDEIGGDLAQDLFKDGMSALKRPRTGIVSHPRPGSIYRHPCLTAKLFPGSQRKGY